MFKRIHSVVTLATLAAFSGAAQAAEPGSPGSMLQVVPGLLVVIGLIAACAWVAKRIGPMRSSSNAAIKLVSAQSLGGRDRVVIVEVNQQWLVLGVSPGRVNTLSQMPKPEGIANEAASNAANNATAGSINSQSKPPFAAWLEKALAKK